MALQDIIERIEGDASAEAGRLLDTAGARADAIREEAEARAAAQTAETLASAGQAARREADTLVVNARLRVRDEELASRRARLDDVLVRVVAALAELPDSEYAEFLAKRIADAGRGGERLLLGAADVSRAPAIAAALARIAPELKLVVTDGAAPFDRGALLVGDRVRANLSLQAIVEERRDDLELVIARVLFGEAGA